MGEPQMLSAEELARIKQLEASSRAQTEKDLATLKEKQAQGFDMEQQREQEYLDRVDPESGEEFPEEHEA